MILIVEDSLFNQQYLRMILSSLGYNSIIAENGKNAVELTLSEKFDLILMDIEMPVMNGIEASREIRYKNNMNCETPIILQSTCLTTPDSSNYMQLFNGKISKPYVKNEILTMLKKYIVNYKNLSIS